MDGSKFVSTYHHCFVIGHIRPQCSLLKKEQNHVARSLPKRPCGHKLIVCHRCGAFGHLRPHCFKFKLLKEKKNLSFLEAVLWKQNRNWGENGKLLKKVFNVLTSLSMCIFGSHSSNSRLTSHETLIPNNHSIWMRKVPMVELMLFWSLI